MNNSIYRETLLKVPNSYLSHYTSMYLHGLTEQYPTNIFLTIEKVAKSCSNFVLDQDTIDKFFCIPHSNPTESFTLMDKRVNVIERNFAGKIGVIEDNDVEFGEIKLTCIERSLIDFAVNPELSGGIFEVRKAYKAAKDIMSIGGFDKCFKKTEPHFSLSSSNRILYGQNGIWNNMGCIERIMHK